MPKGQYKRVSSHNAEIGSAQLEETGGAPATSTPEVRAAMSLQPLLRIATLAQRMAERYVSGKHGLAIENAAHEVLHLWDALPDEIRVLL